MLAWYVLRALFVVLYVMHICCMMCTGGDPSFFFSLHIYCFGTRRQSVPSRLTTQAECGWGWVSTAPTHTNHHMGRSRVFFCCCVCCVIFVLFFKPISLMLSQHEVSTVVLQRLAHRAWWNRNKGRRWCCLANTENFESHICEEHNKENKWEKNTKRMHRPGGSNPRPLG